MPEVTNRYLCSTYTITSWLFLNHWVFHSRRERIPDIYPFSSSTMDLWIKMNNHRQTGQSKFVIFTKLIENVVFMALLVIALYFVHSMILEYLAGKTNFSVSKQAITKEDLPTATVCFSAKTELKHGRDFKIETVTQTGDSTTSGDERNASVITLQEGRNEYEYMSKERRITFLRQMVVPVSSPFFNRSCVSMTFRLRDSFSFNFGNAMHSLGMFFITITNHSDLQSLDVPEIHDTDMYLTSEKNSYGAIYQLWYDGKVEAFPIQTGVFTSIQIPKITRYKYLEGTCVDSSFYECIGSKIHTNNKCQEEGVTCAPFSLPQLNSSQDYPICQLADTIKACKDLVSPTMTTDGSKSSLFHECLGLTSCLIQEYDIKEYKPWSGNPLDIFQGLFSSSIVDDLMERHENKYMFAIDFHDHEWNRGKRTYGLRVDDNKEYLVWTGISLVGNTGGYFGLCVGFSFTGFISWLLNIIPGFIDRICRQC